MHWPCRIIQLLSTHRILREVVFVNFAGFVLVASTVFVCLQVIDTKMLTFLQYCYVTDL